MTGVLNYKITAIIEKILKEYKSPKNMLKGNLQILKDLHYDRYPEIQIAFCEGAVFSEIVHILNNEYTATALPYEAIQEAQLMFLSFCRGEYDY
jgi:dTDP-4-dehydrorhamnose 3,5-epimerase-like enzyme